jgi:3-isopropylmalate/(R)-2-methylmalate dehydratase large subunit
MGTRYALIAPDETTFDYLRRVVPVTEQTMAAAIANWRMLRSDPDAVFDREIALDVSSLAPQVTWGTAPMHAIAVDGLVPDPHDCEGTAQQDGAMKALEYMQLRPGQALTGIPIDAAFIGSCTNARISDLRAAAAILRGQKIAPGVRAMCTPGSMRVRAQAEAEGIAQVFQEAGFEWRKSGCSNCAGREGPIWEDMRVISSTNRNFENRQGPRTRTHLASPATVAASAITGRIADPRAFPALGA